MKTAPFDFLDLGITTYIEPAAAGSFLPMATEAAHVRIEPNGKVTASFATHSSGQGTQTTMAQIVADRLGVPYEDVSVYDEDSSERWVCSEDCGVVINPGIVEGQIAGGLAQAIGMVLLEEMPIDERGNPTAVTFKDYMLPQISDVPDFEYTHIVTPAKGAGGFRGVGEGGAIIGPPTLVNAIHDALAPFGVTCLDLPLTPSKLIERIDAARDHG